MNILRLLAFIVCFGLACPALLLAEEVSSSASPLKLTDENSEDQTWNLMADKLTSLGDGSIVEAEGHVFLQRGSEYLKADFARYYPSTNWVYLRGNVDVQMGKDVIKAEAAEFDLRSRTGWLTNGNIFMEGPHMYFTGERVVKHRGDRYTFNQAKVTACDGPVPAWSMTAEQAVVELDGYAQLYGSSFLVADTGVLSTPYMVVPAKTTRQSGFLPPDYGLSNKRGLYYTQPYYHVIDDSSDMTFYATFMEKMGLMGSAQYRSQTTSFDKTWLMGSMMASKYAYSDPHDDPLGNYNARSNYERYWLRGMADGFLGKSSWRYRMDLDLVSDQNYLREFSSGPIGFDASRDETFNMFGRDLREDDQKRLSAGLVYKNWQRAGLSFGVRYEQDQFLGHGNNGHAQDQTVQQLPSIDAFLYKGRIFEAFPLELEAQANTSYMYRRSGTRGFRTEIYPRLSLPVDLKYASLIVSAGLRQTMYNSNNLSNTNPLFSYYTNRDDYFKRKSSRNSGPKQNGEYRVIPDLDIQLYTDASKIWKFDNKLTADADSVGKHQWTGLRHEVQPRLQYSRVANVDQENNPFYTLDDRLLPKDELIYSLTNLITVKKSSIIQTASEKKGETPSIIKQDEYIDLLRWRLQSGFDYTEAGRTKYRDLYDKRPVMDVISEVDVLPGNFLSYTGKAYVSPYDGEMTRYDHGVNIGIFSIGTWYTGYSYRTKEYEMRQRLQYDNRDDVILESPLRLLNNSFSLNWREWGLNVSEYRNLRTNEVYDRSVDVSYTAQCYRFVAKVKETNYDRSVSFFVELPGLF